MNKIAVLFLLLCACSKVHSAKAPLPALIKKNLETLSKSQLEDELSFAKMGGCVSWIKQREKEIGIFNLERYILDCQALTKDEAYIKNIQTRIIAFYPTWTEKQKTSVIRGDLDIGKSKDEILATLGTPRAINSTLVKGKAVHQFIYGDTKPMYFYFTNNVLTGVQFSQ